MNTFKIWNNNGDPHSFISGNIRASSHTSKMTIEGQKIKLYTKQQGPCVPSGQLQSSFWDKGTQRSCKIPHNEDLKGPKWNNTWQANPYNTVIRKHAKKHNIEKLASTCASICNNGGGHLQTWSRNTETSHSTNMNSRSLVACLVHVASKAHLSASLWFFTCGSTPSNR